MYVPALYFLLDPHLVATLRDLAGYARHVGCGPRLSTQMLIMQQSAKHPRLVVRFQLDYAWLESKWNVCEPAGKNANVLNSTSAT